MVCHFHPAFPKGKAITAVTMVTISLFLMWGQIVQASPEETTSRDFGPSTAAEDPLISRDIPLDSFEGTIDTGIFSDIPISGSYSTDVWRPYPLYGGEMTSMAIGPNDTLTPDGQVVYVGTRDAGVFKTSNGGKTWAPARGGLTFYPIRTLVSDPQNRRILYAGTDFNGIWKSTDGGANWRASSQGLDTDLVVFSIIVDPHNSQVVYAGLAGGVAMVIGNIFKSTNAGATWSVHDTGIPRSSSDSTHTNAIFTMTMDPSNPNILLAGTNFDGIFRTTNGGDSWSAFNTGVPPRHSMPDYLKAINAVGIDPHHNYRPTAIVEGKYYTFQNSAWNQYSNDYSNDSIFRDFLFFHPTDPMVAYSAGTCFSKTINGGLNWIYYLGWGKQSGDVADAAFNPALPDRLYAAAANGYTYMGGTYTSDDDGFTWSRTSDGITALDVRSVAIDPQNSENIYAGTGSNHFYRSSDGGATWQVTFSYAAFFSDIAVYPTDSKKIFAADPVTGLYRSINQGETLENVSSVSSANCIAIANDATHTIYVGGGLRNGVYVSKDGGNTWDQKTNGLPLFGDNTSPVLSLAVDPRNPGTVWAGTQYGGGIVRSTDGGEHWTVMGLTENNFVEAIAFNPVNSKEMLVGAGSWSGGIYKSKDGGVTWVKKISNLGLVQHIVYDPLNPLAAYAASEGSGVLRSLDGGETWQGYSNGIFYPMVYSLAIIGKKSSHLLLAASYGSGLYWMRLSEPERTFLPFLPLILEPS